MQKLLLTCAAFGMTAAPAFAQGTSDNQASADQPKMVTKIVCKKVEEERSIGSRLSSTSKVCRKVTVPADEAKQQGAQPQANTSTNQANGR